MIPDGQDSNTAEPSDSLFDLLTSSLSAPRLGVYLAEAGYVKPQAVDLYVWNAKISEAFQFPIHVFEVVLRNAVSRSVIDRFGVDWDRSTEFLSVLDESRIGTFEKARQRLRKVYTAEYSRDQFIAALPIGIWVHLLDGRYHEAIWRERIRVAFPNLPKTISRKGVFKKADQLAEIRNRIAHHEPIMTYDLSSLHTSAIESTSWVCEHTSAWAKSHSRVQAVLRERPKPKPESR
jgi:hypothetical protein